MFRDGPHSLGSTPASGRAPAVRGLQGQRPGGAGRSRRPGLAVAGPCTSLARSGAGTAPSALATTRRRSPRRAENRGLDERCVRTSRPPDRRQMKRRGGSPRRGDRLRRGASGRRCGRGLVQATAGRAAAASSASGPPRATTTEQLEILADSRAAAARATAPLNDDAIAAAGEPRRTRLARRERTPATPAETPRSLTAGRGAQGVNQNAGPQPSRADLDKLACSEAGRDEVAPVAVELR